MAVGCFALSIVALMALGPSARPASAADWYQVNVCADPGWLEWAETMDGYSNDWSLSGNCSATGSDYAIDFAAEWESLSLGEEMSWIYPNKRDIPRAGLKIIYADLILAGNDGSDAGARQGIRFCGAACGDLITLSQPSLPEDEWERTIVTPGQAGLPADATELRFSSHCTTSPCGPTQSLKILKLLLKFEDRERPTGGATTIETGSPTPRTLGWMAGPFRFRWNAQDLDSGVSDVTIAKKGSLTAVLDPALGKNCFDFEYAGLCPTSHQANATINPADGIWSEGLNEVFVDVVDRAQNRSLRTATPDFSFYVDRRNPTPQGLSVRAVAPTGWVSDPAITLDWTNEGERDESRLQPNPHSGVAAVEYDFQPRDEGQSDPAPQRVEGRNIETIDVEIPGRGAWDVVVRTIDSVGNHSAPMTEFVGFDDAVPGAPQIDPLGWVGSAHLLDGLPFTWTKPSPTPSGICGYGHSVDATAGTDAPTAMSIVGDVAQATLPNGNVEGPRYLHLRAISCAEVPGDTAHRRFEADLVPPKAQANLASGTWTGQSSALRVSATDDGSGVQDVQLKIGGSSTVFPGSEAVPDLPEGKHTIEYTARDNAGNVSQPETMTVGVDRSVPIGSFDPASEERPTLLSATVVDRLSGVRNGWIDYRPAGGAGEWVELKTDKTEVADDGTAVVLTARFPDISSPEGAYELRARVMDRVGNLGEVRFRRLGGPAGITTPVRKPTRLTFAFESRRTTRCAKRPPRRCNQTLNATSKIVDFGRGARAAGRLVDSAGRPLAGKTITLTTQRTGARGEIALTEVKTDSRGRFRAYVGPGVNRRVFARFLKDELLKPATDSVFMATRSKLTLRAVPRRVRRGGRLLLRGRLYTGGEKIVLGRPVYVKALGTIWSVPVNVRPDGRFSVDFPTGKRGMPVRLALQAQIPVQDGWPYHSGRSRIVEVTLVP